MVKKEPRICELCGEEFLAPIDSDERYCPTCREMDTLSLGPPEPNNREGLRF